MTKRGILPHHLASCLVLNCQACFYEKATKKSWWSKTSDEERKAQTPSCSTRQMHLYWYDDLTNPRPGCPNVRQTYLQEVLPCGCLYWLGNWSGLCLVTEIYCPWRHHGGQNHFWEVLSRAWGLCQVLSCWQWDLCIKCMEAIMSLKRTRPLFCWCCSTPSKWHSREEDKGTARDDVHHAHPCPAQMAQCHLSKSLAICTEDGKWCYQCHSKPQVQGCMHTHRVLHQDQGG